MSSRVFSLFLLAMAFASAAHAQAVNLTIITAVRVGQIEGATNTTIADYVYTVDPLSRGVTMAGAAITVPSTNDRLSVILGGVITPAGGFGVATSGHLGRGFGLTAGYAWLFVNAPKEGKGIGNVPDNLTDPDPFRMGVARTWFVGASYTFRRNR
ncbi:MAG: hypothetical protein M3R55_13660 [Acidobacteriota bacterium]|nr:hypothetical protein [Acidobacteriota bacterium]